MDGEIDHHHHIDGSPPITETGMDAVCLDPGASLMAQSSQNSDQEPGSQSRGAVDVIVAEARTPMTSTPIPARPRSLSSRLLASQGTNTSPRGSGCSADSLGVGTCVNVTVEEQMESEESCLQAPIIGYEVMEQRAKFTVFKIHVRRSDHENWLIFRRYTDFVRVNDKLKEIFPVFRLALPPKRWFGSNFDPNFLEDRQLGLQAFINNIIGHKDIVLSGPVREFLCLDDPPGPHDNLEESRALCESLDETVYSLRMELAERDRQIAILSTELHTAQEQISQLRQSQIQSCSGATKSDSTQNSSTPVSGENSTIEGDLHSQAEADQSLSFTPADVNISRCEPPHNEDSASTGDAGSQSLSSTSSSGLKQGTVQSKEEENQRSKPNIITVT